MHTTLQPKHSRGARRAAIGAVVTLGLGLGVCAFAAKPAAIEVRSAWIRWLPAGLPAGGYMTLENHSTRPIDLVGARSPAYGDVMLHRSVRKGGTMEMLAVHKVTIPPHAVVEFRPGDYHIMLMQPKQDIHPGQRVPVNLEFSGGASLRVEFEVRPADASGASAANGMNMHGMNMGGMDMHGSAPRP